MNVVFFVGWGYKGFLFLVVYIFVVFGVYLRGYIILVKRKISKRNIFNVYRKNFIIVRIV